MAHADKRTVSTDALETLGTIIDETAGRDAIHLAVEPVVAAESLQPGWHVKLVDGKAHRAETGKGVGIVDPFLSEAVAAGERFWLVVYPRKITSLRHVWTHPEFPDADKAAAATATPTDPVEVSRRWIAEFAQQCDQTYNRLMTAADAWAAERDYTYDNTEAYKEVPYEKWQEFWKHYEVVTGIKVDVDDDAIFFTCSC